MTHNPAEALRDIETAKKLVEKFPRFNVEWPETTKQAWFETLERLAAIARSADSHALRGIFASLDAAQRRAALTYDGPTGSGDIALAALTSPAPAGGEGHAFSPSALPRVCAICERDAESHGSDGWSLDAPATPLPHPRIVAGVVEMLKRGAQSIDNDATSSQAGPGAEELRSVATLLESLSAEKGRLVEALTEMIETTSCQEFPANIGGIRLARDRARTALTPKEKA